MAEEMGVGCYQEGGSENVNPCGIFTMEVENGNEMGQVILVNLEGEEINNFEGMEEEEEEDLEDNDKSFEISEGISFSPELKEQVDDNENAEGNDEDKLGEGKLTEFCGPSELYNLAGDFDEVEDGEEENEEKEASLNSSATTIETVDDKQQVIDGISSELKCEICSKVFNRVHLLKLHMGLHTGHRPFKCEKCEKTFLGNMYLQAHMVKTHRISRGASGYLKEKRKLDNYYSSRRMKRKTKSKKDPMSAVTEIIKQEKMETPMPSSSSGSTPTPTSTSSVPYKPGSLPIKKEKEDLKNTSGGKSVKSVKNGSVTCKVCQKTFTHPTKLKIHKRIHTGERPYKCTHPGCSHAFIDISYLNSHIVREHVNKKRQAVNKGKGPKFSQKKVHFAGENELVPHNSSGSRQQSSSQQLSVSSEPPKLSNSGAISPQSSIYHQVLSHSLKNNRQISGRPEGEEEEDGGVFPILVFPQGYDFICPFCFKCYKDRTIMIQHLSCHIENLPSSSESEGNITESVAAATAAAVKLPQAQKKNRLDQKSLSSPESDSDSPKKHVCNVCGTDFKAFMKLHVHMRIHTDQRPYECRRCPQKFRQAIHLKRHMIVIHKLAAKDVADIKEEIIENPIVTTSPVAVEKKAVKIPCSVSLRRCDDKMEKKKMKIDPDASEDGHVLPKVPKVEAATLANANDKKQTKTAVSLKVGGNANTKKKQEPQQIEIRKRFGQKGFQCMECNAVIAARIFMREHRESHMRESSSNNISESEGMGPSTPRSTAKIYKCKKCPKSFKIKESFKYHMLWRHKSTESNDEDEPKSGCEVVPVSPPVAYDDNDDEEKEKLLMPPPPPPTPPPMSMPIPEGNKIYKTGAMIIELDALPLPILNDQGDEDDDDDYPYECINCNACFRENCDLQEHAEECSAPRSQGLELDMDID